MYKVRQEQIKPPIWLSKFIVLHLNLSTLKPIYPYSPLLDLIPSLNKFGKPLLWHHLSFTDASDLPGNTQLTSEQIEQQKKHQLAKFTSFVRYLL